MISLAENCDEYAEARAAFADGEMQVLFCGEWYDVVGGVFSGSFASMWKPEELRRRPKVDEATTEPSVLQEHANLIAKLEGEDAEVAPDDDGWWGDFGYVRPPLVALLSRFAGWDAPEIVGAPVPASDRNGIANEAMREAMTQKPAAPEPKPLAPEGVYQIAPLGRNARGWGVDA